MRGSMIFLTGLTLGATLATAAAQDRRLPGMNGVNHIAIVTDKYEAMKEFYVQTMGFPEAFTVLNGAGQPTLTYLQASRSSFIELFPASPGRAVGFQHYGVHVDDINATAARLKERGMTVGMPRPSASGSITLTVTDPDGIRIELSELGPTSKARLAMERWR
jgi:catechol 2,3-dioxygenase-like lactoylglutathione lyase family enzyme